ncbi:MAG: type I restriction enzyme endonuclease domain-containing protein [bacterium]
MKDESIRVVFYDKLLAFARLLKLALSSIHFPSETNEKTINRYMEDLAFFLKLRSAVLQRYSDDVDYKQYEGQIQKLIDTHVQTDDVKPITELVNIFEKERFEEEVEKTIGIAAKADKIASRTAKHISEKMEEDPAFYKKFSEMLKETIEAHEQARINDAQKLKKVTEIMNAVLSHTDADIPESLSGRDVAKAFFGLAKEGLAGKFADETVLKSISADIAIAADEIIKQHIVVDWQVKIDVPKRMFHVIGDYLIDEVRDKYHLQMTFEEIDSIAERIIDVAKIRYKK